MMYIETKDGRRMWHLGGGIPSVPRVCKIQADGHELEMILVAMGRAAIGPGGRVVIPPDYAELD